MDTSSELLMRSTLHDLANVLAGVRGILDLSNPQKPLSPRDRLRLDAVLDEGICTLERSRSLVMGTLPEALPEPGLVWRDQLLDDLAPLATLFHCRFEISHEGEAATDQWPGELLRGYARAITRQVLPYVQDGCMNIQCSADHREWRLRWSPAPLLPASLTPEGTPMDISSRWALQVGAAIGATLSQADGALLARIPRF